MRRLDAGDGALGVGCAKLGVGCETTERLIATVVGDPSAGALAAAGNLDRLSRGDPSVWARESALPVVGLARLAAAFELGRRVEQERSSPGQPLSSPGAVYRYLAPSLRGLTRETFVVILLDGRHRPLGVERISEGTLTSSLVHPREVFASAIEGRAAAIVLAHNHPSGDPEPSQEDHEVTRRLVRAGQLLGIQVLDHVILGLGAWTSLRESSAGDLFQEGRWRAGEVAGEDPV